MIHTKHCKAFYIGFRPFALFFSTLLHFIQVCWQMIAIMLYQMTVVAMTVAMDVRKCIENLLISDWRYHYYTYENYASTFNTDRLTVTS